MRYILNKDGSVSKADNKNKKAKKETSSIISTKPLEKSVKNFSDTFKNSAVANHGLNFSNVVTDMANIDEAGKNVLKSIPIIGDKYKLQDTINKSIVNTATNLGTGAVKTAEGVADTASDLIFNPAERAQNYAFDYITKGKKTADENLKDLEKMQKRDIKKNMTEDFLNKTGYNDVADELEKNSLVTRNNVAGQVAQGIGGMVPSLVLGQALGGTPQMTDLAGLTGKEKLAAALGNIGKTYIAQLPANATLSASAYGGGMEEALNEGANMTQARLYGLSDAAIENLTEMLTGGVPGLQGKGGIDQFVDPVLNKSSNKYLNALLKAGYGAFGEGLEEYAAEMLNPIAKKIYSNEKINWDETRAKARQAGLVGMLTGAFLNSQNTINDFKNAKNVNTQSNIQQTVDDVSKPNPDRYIPLEKQNVVNQEENNNIKQQETQNEPKLIENVDNVEQNEPKLIEINDNVETANKNVVNEEENIANNEPTVKSEEYKEAKKKVADGTATEKERSYIQTATEAQNTQRLTEQMDEVAKNYQPMSNEETLQKAEQQLKNFKTIEEKVNYVNDLLKSDKRLKAKDMAVAELVLRDAASTKNAKLYNEVLENLSIYATEQGQSIQALSLIKQLSPTNQLDVLEKIIQREQAKGNKTYEGLEVTDEMRNKILDCYDENGNINQEKFNETMNDIKQELANKMHVSWDEKIRAWRYLSMLGNPKTHVRNIVANVAMNFVKNVKDKVSGGLQDVFIRDKSKKTATLQFASKDVKNLATEMYEQVSGDTFGNKYNEKTELENMRKVFDIKPLQKISEFNDTALSQEDQHFKKKNFKRSFANYLTAQGISTKADIEANPQIVEKAKQFAVQEANVATFNQKNKLSEFINSADYKLGLPGRVIRGAILPFSRTPLNIAETGIEYTPGTGLATTVKDVKNAPSNMKGAVLIDGISKQITGSSLALLGYALAKGGIITSKPDEDKEGKFKSDQGSEMNYSIKIGDTSYDLSWLAPSSIPFFVGARMFEVLDKQEGINENVILESLASTLDPLSEMSCVSSFTDILNSYSKSGTGMLKDMGISTMQNYLSQFIPTVVGQFARVFDDKKRTTYADSNSTNKISQETYRELAYKIPGLRNTLPESTDYLGKTKKEEENIFVRAFDALINPSNKRKDTMTKEGEEILRLYNKTGNDDIIPAGLNQKIVFNNNYYQMTRKEYNEYKKSYGDAFEQNVKKIMDTSEYKSASDDEKAEMIAGVMNYAKDKAKDEYLTKQGVDYSKTTKTGEKSKYLSDKVDALTNDDFTIADYYIYKTYASNLINGKEQDIRNRLNTINAFGIDYQTYSKYMKDIKEIKGDTDKNGKTISNSRKKKVYEYINSLDLTSEQKKLLMKKAYSSFNSYDKELFNTINSSDLTLEEKESLKNFLKIGK